MDKRHTAAADAAAAGLAPLREAALSLSMGQRPAVVFGGSALTAYDGFAAGHTA